MHVGAVVAAVPNLVFVVVKLTGVEEKLAVVLEENAREEPDAPRGAGMSAIGLKRLSTGRRASEAAPGHRGQQGKLPDGVFPSNHPAAFLPRLNILGVYRKGDVPCTSGRGWTQTRRGRESTGQSSLMQ